MLTRFTFLMQITTAPPNKVDASPHTGGWSESFWVDGIVPTNAAAVQTLLTKRALLLPSQGSIVGVRNAQYDISGNKLIPKGASTAKVNFPGNSSLETDLPQVSLEMAATATGAPNNTRFNLRGIPDVMMSYGEYQPTTAFKAAVTQFGTALLAGFGFVGRDLSLASQKVNSIAGSNITTLGALGAVVGTDFVIFKRVYDDAGNPVKGSFLVTNALAGNIYTLAGFGPVTMTTPSGLARVDKIAFYTYQTITPARAVVRKIGRPFASYRGRQSKS